jgi:hypothetical protein
MTKMMTRVAGVAVVMACLAQVGCMSYGGSSDDVGSGISRSQESVVVERSNGVSYERREMKLDPGVSQEYRQAMINTFLKLETGGVAVSR